MLTEQMDRSLRCESLQSEPHGKRNKATPEISRTSNNLLRRLFPAYSSTGIIYSNLLPQKQALTDQRIGLCVLSVHEIVPRGVKGAYNLLGISRICLIVAKDQMSYFRAWQDRKEFYTHVPHTVIQISQEER